MKYSDLMITKYSIILASYDGEDPLDIYNLKVIQ